VHVLVFYPLLSGTLFEGSQSSVARPSDCSSTQIKTSKWWK